ncbi:hypothetical protein BC628DRAFT_1379633 [Trametes gibbosa]|nr:hypothetical protein BC628DRAFT_1379633 [Trametes gibbosa]
MLTRFDSGSSFFGTSKTQQPEDDYLPVVGHNTITRTASEVMNDAYRHFSALSPVSQAARGEPPLSQILDDLDPYKHAYADDVEEWPEDEQSSQPAGLNSFNQAGISRAQMIPVRMGSFSQPFRQPLRSTLSQLLGPLPASASLESAPPPDFSSIAPPVQSMAPIKEEYSPMDEDEDEDDDDRCEPLPLSDLVYWREDTPTPDALRRGSVAALRRAATLPALNISQAARHVVVRGASSRDVGEEAEASPIRRSRRVQAKVDELRASNVEVNGIYAPSMSHRKPRRK